MKNNVIKVSVGLTLASLIFLLMIMYAFISGQYQKVGASVGNEGYSATTTSPQVALTTGGLIKSGPGILGSVVITGAGTGSMTFYDATTTNVSARAAYMSTSTITIANFPVSVVAGTYTFDITTANGLIVTIAGSATPTTTITYR